jgi:hypothetical protein
MKLFLPAVSILLFFSLQLSAKVITQADARKVATSVIREKAPSSNQDFALSDEVFTVSRDGSPVYYVIDLTGKGFVIVSADDVVYPVLGYSFSEGYIADNQPENLADWMNGYADQIIYARDHSLQPDGKITQMWENYLNGKKPTERSVMTGVEPMLTSTWNQGAPYNLLCPADPTGPGGHVYAGCVATAMAQIAYYWRWPLQGTGSHGYNCANYGYLYADFGNTYYHWDEMINGAVGFNYEMAQLQSHFGIAVDMMYSPDGSGAYSEDAANAMKTYFGYSDELTLVYKSDYSDEDWSNLMRQQLDAGQPMYYHGFGSGGHAFNLDGYSDDQYFHFNWGWGGTANGYYLLSNLNPAGSNFSNGQGAIINFVPDANYPYYCSEANTLSGNYGTIEDGSGPLQPYLENSGCSWLIAPVDSVSGLKLTFHRFSLEENHDFLTIYDGGDTTASVLAELTGQSIPSPITASGAKMYLKFTSDNAGSDNGWFASYSTQAVNFCPGVTTMTEPSGTFTDGSGNFDYHNNSICKYKIIPENANSITLVFNEFDTYDENDYLLIIDINTGNTLYKISGRDNPGPLYLNTGKVLIFFKTDQANTAQGWNIAYQADTYTGIILSSATMFYYPNPVSDVLNVTIKGTLDDECLLTLTDASGRTIFSKQVINSGTSSTLQLNVSGYPAGIYTLRCMSKKNVAIGKVVIE